MDGARMHMYRFDLVRLAKPNPWAAMDQVQGAFVLELWPLCVFISLWLAGNENVVPPLGLHL